MSNIELFDEGLGLILRKQPIPLHHGVSFKPCRVEYQQYCALSDSDRTFPRSLDVREDFCLLPRMNQTVPSLGLTAGAT